MSIKDDKMKKWYEGVTGVYLILIIVFPLFWIQLGGAEFFPGIMFAYIYPYTYAEKGFDESIFLLLVVFQFVVFASYIVSIIVYRSKKRILNYFAGILAILWFVGVSFVFFIAHLH